MEFRETRQARNAVDTAVWGCPSLAQPMETPVVAVAVLFYESECQEQTSSRQSAEQKLLWHSALNLDGARQSGPNAGVGSTTSFLA